MKKIILFLTLSFIYFLSSGLIVNAKTDNFYEAEYLDGIYMVRYDKKTNIKYYQKARMYRRVSDNKEAYCLEPFKLFDPNSQNYETKTNLENIDNKKLERIKDLIGFGYKYPGHQEEKWYAITQLLIWQTMEPDSEFYFTDSLNGNKIEPYNKEINLINNLINESYNMPSFNNQTFYGVINKPITITDTNKIFAFYNKEKTSNTILNNNSLTVTKEKEGCYDEYFYRYYNHSNEEALFYYNSSSQLLATTGNPNNRIAKVTYCFNNLKLNIKKIDSTTKDTTSPGEASLKDAIFTLYNENMEKLTDLNLNENYEAKISSETHNFLNYGKYYLKETKSGTGYLENNKTYEINFTPENKNIELIIENEVIEKDLTIKKYYGDGLFMEPESKVTFEIYNKDDTLIDKITTNQNGIAKVSLPYGHYKIVQINTATGYTKAKPFTVFINDLNKDYNYIINDYKINEEKIEIKVPDTSTNIGNSYLLLNTIYIGLFFVKKKFN